MSLWRLSLAQQPPYIHWMTPRLSISNEKIGSLSSSGHEEHIAADFPIRLLVLEVSNLRRSTFPYWRRLCGCAGREALSLHLQPSPPNMEAHSLNIRASSPGALAQGDLKANRAKTATVTTSACLSFGHRNYISHSSGVDREIAPEPERNMKIHYPVKKVYVAA